MDNTAEQVLRTLRELVAEGGYTIGCNECIQNPGCFEGEPQEILYWHSLHMQGISAPIADMESDGYYACQFPVFAEYTPEQIEWAESSECETAAAMLSEITQ